MKNEETKYLFSLINEIDHQNIMKVDYFVENKIFYVVRTYDDDYVIITLKIKRNYKLQTYLQNLTKKCIIL